WIGACKPPYVPLALLVFAVPADRFGGKLRRAAIAGTILAVGIVVAAVASHLSRPYYPDPNNYFGFPVSVREQSQSLIAHPERVAEAFVRTIVARGVPTYFRLYSL